MEDYVTVLGEACAEYSEKRSKFIARAMFCDTQEKAAELIAKIKSKHFDARHNVYAYVLSDGTARFSDDGEPHGTAGKPILDVINGSKIKNVLIVVTRYFGGVLLGTGGLVRAYQTSAKDALNSIPKAKMCLLSEYAIKCGYPYHQRLVNVIEKNNAVITDTVFTDSVEVFAEIKSERGEDFERSVFEAFSSKIVPKKVKDKYSAVKIEEFQNF